MLRPTIYIPSHAIKLQAHELRQAPLQKPALRLMRAEAQGTLKGFCRLPGASQFPEELPSRRVG